jgi:hypothetical protein
MKMQSAIRESKNQRTKLIVSLGLMTVSALDLVAMLETIRQFWNNLGWEIIFRTPLLECAFEIGCYMLLAMSGFWLAKACWKVRAVEGLKQVGGLMLLATLSATAILMMSQLPVAMKINAFMVMILAAMAIVCVEAVRCLWANLPRRPKSAPLIELTSQG